MDWRLAEAKNRLSEVFNRALSEGPQRVLRRQDSIIVLSEKDYQKLTQPKPSFKEFLLQSSPRSEDLEWQRDPSPMREVDW